MLKVPIDRIVPVTNARAKIASLVKNVQDEKSLYVITRGGRPAAVLASIDYIEKQSPKKSKVSKNLPESFENKEELPAKISKKESSVELKKEEKSDIVPNNEHEEAQLSSFDDEQPVEISIG